MSAPDPAVPLGSGTPPHVTSGPSPTTLRLGYGGLLPFVFGAALLWIVRPDAHPYVALALSAYAAAIVSFLGGIHWGLGFRAQPADTGRFAWGVVPSLAAWIAMLMPPHVGLVVLGATLVLCYAVDRRVYPRHGAAAWLALRLRLTLVASVSCFVGAAAC